MGEAMLVTMKSKSASAPLPSVFPKVAHALRSIPTEAAKPKLPKRDNIFSQSRDTSEDRGMRQMKNNNNSQTFPHAR